MTRDPSDGTVKVSIETEQAALVCDHLCTEFVVTEHRGCNELRN